MRVCYIFREKERNEHSIEAVYDTIASELADKIEIDKWYKPRGWKNTFKSIRQLRRGKYDVYHITGDVYYLWPFFPWRKTIMTVHDIGMYKNFGFVFWRFMFVVIGFVIPSLFHKRLIAVSDLTKDDLHRYLHIPLNRIVVIQNPLSLKIGYSLKEFNSRSPIIMQIGTGEHKNLDSLIKAVRGVNCTLDIIGNPSPDLRMMMSDYGICHKISYNISKEEVIEHYQNCDILYFVSRSEGFGLPILEAQAVGRPVITSCQRPMPQVAGEGGALFCEPEDVEAIRCGLQKIISSTECRNKLVKVGLENVKKYSPSNAANAHLKLYQQLFKCVQ